MASGSKMLTNDGLRYEVGDFQILLGFWRFFCTASTIRCASAFLPLGLKLGQAETL